MRTTISIALATFISFIAFAQANAVSMIEVTYLGGASGTVTDNSADASIGDLLTFQVSAFADAASLIVLSFGLEFQSDENLVLSSANWNTGTQTTFFMFDPGPPIVVDQEIITYLTPIESSPEANVTQFNDIGFGTINDKATSTNVFFGTVVFDVQGAGTIEVGFFDSLSAVAQDESTAFITPDFDPVFNVTVPEPAATAALVCGLGTLAALSWRRRQES